MKRTGLISRRLGLVVLAGVLAILPVGSWTYITRSFGDNPDDIKTITTGIDIEPVVTGIDVEPGAGEIDVEPGAGEFYIGETGVDNVDKNGIEKTVTERFKSNHSVILTRCAADLGKWWPVPTEWTMSREGCVIMPERAEIAVPKSAGLAPYAYRLFDLDTNQWNSALSRASFLRMSGNFPGRVLQGDSENPDRFVLVLPYEPEEEIINDDYVPELDPAMVLRRSFVGIIRLDRKKSGNEDEDEDGIGTEIGGLVDLNPGEVIMRLVDARLMPVHVYRDLDSRQTRVKVLPEQIETREVEFRQTETRHMKTRQVHANNQVDVTRH